MPENEIAVSYRAMRYKLAGEDVWQDKVFAGHIMDSDTVPMPYVLMIGSGEDYTPWVRGGKCANLSFTVKIVSDDQETAYKGAARIKELLHDQGTQDRTATPLNGGTDWEIVTSTKEEDIDYIEVVKGSIFVYHVGSQYRLRLERTS